MITIRPYHPSDLDGLYAVSLATADRGGDASHLYADPRLVGHIYSAPYAALLPDLTFVIQDSEGVAGFVVGAVDTTAWERSLAANWWPSLRAQYPGILGRHIGELTPDQRRIEMIHRPEHVPAAIAARFPQPPAPKYSTALSGRGLWTPSLRNLDGERCSPWSSGDPGRRQQDQRTRRLFLVAHGLCRRDTP